MLSSTNSVLMSFEETVERYLSELTNLSMEQLVQTTSEEEWSLGQMYMHLIQSALFMHLRNAGQCLAEGGAAPDATAEKTERGKAAFEQGSFPRVRIRVPASPQYTPQQPESKEQLIEGFSRVVEQMKHMESALSQAAGSSTVLHPGFGALNAAEWFQLVEMHYRHHLLQLERLKSELNISQGTYN